MTHMLSKLLDHVAEFSAARLSRAVLAAFLFCGLTQAWGQTQFSFTESAYTVGENGLTITITVQRNSGVGEVSVDYSITGGTAVNGVDYYAEQFGSLSFLEGEMTRDIFVDIFDNTLRDGNRTVQFTLTDPVGGTLGSPRETVLTIVDNEPPVVEGGGRFAGAFVWTTDTYITSERDLEARVTVTRVGSAEGRCFVDYTITDGTAMVNRNYFLPDGYQESFGTLVFEDFQMSADIYIPLTDDFPAITNNPPLEFYLTLSNPRLDPDWWEPDLEPTLLEGFENTTVYTLDTDSGFNFENLRYIVNISYYSNILGNLRIWVNLPDTHNDGTTVSYRTWNINTFTLNAGSDYSEEPLDYTGVSGTLTYGKDTYWNSFLIPIRGWGTNVEFNKDIIMELYNPSGTFVENETNEFRAWLGQVSVATITLVPNGDLGPAGEPGNVTSTATPVAPGALDATFIPNNVSWTLPPYNSTPGANNTVYAVVVQPDDYVLIGGDFNAVNTDPWNHLARLMPDGKSDHTFNIGTGADNFVQTIALYTNGPHAGKIVIGGGFTSYNGIQRNGIARINADGTLDTGFNPGSGADGLVWSVAVQPDGKVLMAGEFLSVAGFTRRHIARLNVDGTVDQSFNPGNGPEAGTDDRVRSIAVMGDGVAIGGDFSMVNGVVRWGIARLNDDGTLDTNFDPGSGTDGAVNVIAVQPDQKLILGGEFTTINLYSRNRIARLNADGSLDTTFDPGTGMNNTVLGLRLLPDGKVLAFGAFSSYNDTRRVGLARIHSFGTVDTSFLDTAYNQYAGIMDRTNFVWSGDIQANGAVIIGGFFQRVGGGPYSQATGPSMNPVLSPRIDWHPRYNIARLAAGSLNGPGYVEFTLPEFRCDEYGGPLYALLMRRDGNLGGITVSNIMIDALALSGLDYDRRRNPARWAQHAGWYMADGAVNSITFNPAFIADILNDSLIEGNESFTLKIQPPFDALWLGGEAIPLGTGLGRREALGTIVDDDFKRGDFNFSTANYIVNEGAVYVNVVVERLNGTAGQASVRYTTAPSTISPATANVDYTPKSGTLTFSSGQASNTFRINITPDTLVEPDENFNILLYNPSGAALGSLSNTVVTIIDDDYKPGRLSFSSATYTENETTPYATITVQRRGGNLGQVSVRCSTLQDTAIPGINYSNVNIVLTWADGDSADKTFQVPIINNGLVEGNRVLSLLMSQFVSALPGGTTNAQLTIIEDDAYGNFEFSAPNYLADENGVNAIITVIRTGGIAGNISVNYATAALPPGTGAATANLDYTNRSGTLSFTPGQLSATFQVPIRNDLETEGDETVNLLLSNPVGGAGLGARSTAILTIVDDESVNIPAGTPDTSFVIGAGPNNFVNSIILQTNGDLVIGGEFTAVNNAPRNHLARLRTEGSLDPSFGVGVGVNGSIYSLALQEDGRILLGGSFSSVNGTNRNNIARMNFDGSVDNFYNPGAGADNPVNVIKLQKFGSVEKAYLGGNFSTFNGVSRNAVARLNDNGTLDTSFNPGTGANGPVYALALQTDGKLLVGGNFNVFNGQSNFCIVRLNTNGTMDATFNPGTGANGAVRAVAVQSDGKIVLGGVFTSFNGNTNCSRIVRLLPTGEIDLNFMNAVGTGANGGVLAITVAVDGKLVISGDFTRFNGITRNRLTRLNPDGSVDPTINFGIGANDFVSCMLIQPDRKIVIGGAFTMFNDVTNNHLARLHGGSLMGSGTLQFASASYVVFENQTNLVMEVERRGGTMGAVSIYLQTFDGTATATLDYLTSDILLTFPEGETRLWVPIRILDDNLVESDETFQAVLSNPIGGALLGGQPTADALIINDDAEVSFTASSYTVIENFATGNASIGVTRRGALSTLVTVDYRTQPGTGIPGLDYTSVSGTLTFYPGETTRFFNVPILINPEISDNKTVLLQLRNMVGQGQIVAPSNALLTILEYQTSPGAVTFGSSQVTVGESETNLVLSVVRTNGHTGNVTVQYTTSDITARAGQDYTGKNDQLAFADGETLKQITIPITPDTIVEGNETFGVSLFNPNGGLVLGSISHVTVNIEDDDFGPGSLDPTFDPGSGANGYVRSLGLLRDDRIVIGGAFTRFRGATNNYIARVLTNGLNDTTFNTGAGANALVSSVAVETNGNIVIGGSFTAVNNLPRMRLARILSTGTPDPNLTQDTAINSSVFAVRGAPDNKLMAGGSFTAPQPGLCRLQASGVLDTSFNTGAGITNGSVFALLADGNKTLVGGSFTEMDHVPRNKVVRVNANGSVDLGFTPPVLAGGHVYALGLQSDGKVIVGGDFKTIDGNPRTRLARLNADGTLDSGFAAVTISNGIVYGIAVQLDGKVITVGSFTNVNGNVRNRIARFLNDGSLDPSFDPGLGANNTVYAIGLQADGRIIIGGDFTYVNGFLRNGLARLNGDPVIPPVPRPDFTPGGYAMNNDRFTMTWKSQLDQIYLVEYSFDLVTWELLTIVTAEGDTANYTDYVGPGEGHRFYRIQLLEQ